MAPQPHQPDLVNFFDAPASNPMANQPSAPIGNNPFAAFGAPPPVPPAPIQAQPQGTLLFMLNIC